MPESDNRPLFKAGDIIQHFKHEHYPADSPMYTYRILGYATHSETRETLVIYEALYALNSEDTLKVFARHSICSCQRWTRRNIPTSGRNTDLSCGTNYKIAHLTI